MDVHTIVQLFLSGTFLAGMYISIALGLSLIFGVMQIVNVAHGTLVMVGGYIGWIAATNYGINPILSLLIIIPVLFVLGYVLEVSIIEPVVNPDEEMYSLMLTFGLSLAIEGILTEFFGTVPRSVSYLNSSFNIFGYIIGQSKVIAGGLGWVFAIGFAIFLSRSKYGQAIRATAQAPDLAEACGINAPRIRAITFSLGTMLAGVGGLGYLITFTISPVSGRFLVLLAFVIVVLGGLNSLQGTAVAGFLVALFLTFGRYYIGSQGSYFIAFISVVAILLIVPHGLLGDPEEMKNV